MIKIDYLVNKVKKETYYKPNITIAKWFIKEKKLTTHKLGEFIITKL